MPQVFLLLASGAASIFGGGSLITQGLVGLWGLATTTIGSALVNLGFAVAFSYLSALLRDYPDPQKVQQTIRSTVSPRVVPLGRVKVSGTRVFLETKSGTLSGVLAMGHGRMDAIEEFWVDDQLVTPDVTTGLVAADPYHNRLRIRYRLGLDTETHYSELTTDFPVWTSAHRGDGIASLYFKQLGVKSEDIGSVFPRIAETLYRWVARGRVTYDPTNVSHDIDSEATWSWSDNWARNFLFYCMHADGARMPHEVLFTPLAIQGWKDAVADCADPIPLAIGGTEQRYSWWGSYAMDERPADVMQRMMMCSSARFELTQDGGLTVRVGKWRAPTVTLTKYSIRSFEGISNGYDILSTANLIRSKYLSAPHDYQLIDAQPWENAADIAAAGMRPTDVTFAGCPSHPQARRLSKIYAGRIAPDWTGTFNTDLSACEVIGEPTFALDYQIGDLDISCDAEIVDARIIVDQDATIMGFQISYASITEEMFAWDAATEEGEAPIADTTEGDTTVPVPTNFTATLVRQTVSGLSLPFARLVWDALPEGQRPSIRYKQTLASTWTPVATNEGDTTVDIPLTNDGATYEFEMRATALTRYSAYIDSTPSTLVAIGDPVAPAAPTIGTVTVADGIATIPFTMPNSPNTYRARVYRSTAAGSFGTAVEITSSPLLLGPNSVYSFIENVTVPTVASYKYYVTAENASGVKSTEAGPSNTVTAGFHAAALAYFAAVHTAGDTTYTLAWKIKVNTLISGMDADGTWALIRHVLLLKNHSQIAANIDLKSLTVAVNSGATWSSAGYTGNGSSAQVSLGVSISGLGLTANDHTIAAWISGGTDAADDNKYVLGVNNTSALSLTPRNANDAVSARVGVGNVQYGANGTAPSIIGSRIATSRGATDREAYVDGVSVGTYAAGSPVTTTATIQLFRWSTNYSDYEVPATLVATGISDAQVTSIHARMTTALA